METLGLEPKKKAEKKLSQRVQVLGLLMQRGSTGATSEELNSIGFRYSSIIFALRKEGHHIETRARKGTELARFIWWGPPSLEPVQLELIGGKP